MSQNQNLGNLGQVLTVNAASNTVTVNSQITVGNTNMHSTGITIGNTSLHASGLTINGTAINTTSFAGTANNTLYVGSVTAANVVSNAQLQANVTMLQGQITSNASAAYTNSVSYTDSAIGTANTAMVANASAAYSNSVTYTDTKIGTANTAMVANASAAYTNATVFASNASNVNTGTLAEARLPYRMNQNVRNTDTVEFGGMTLTGNLVVSGNVNIIGANNLSISDNMIYLNSNNDVSNPDLGIAGNYNDGTYAHTGFFRDATDGIWKVFDNYGPEPDDSPYIDTSNTTFHLANFQANTIYGGNTTTNWFVANTSGAYTTLLSGNVSSSSYVSVGNSTVNAVTNSSSITFNSSVAAYASFYKPSANGSAYVAVIGSNNASNPFWNGWQFVAPGVFANSSAGNAFPRTSHFYSFTSTSNPSDLYYNIQAGNDGGIGTGIKIYATSTTNSRTGVDILANGNVGIANTTPTDKLSVTGTTYLGGAVTSSINFSTNSSGIYHTGTVNAASHTVGSSTIANSSGVYAAVINASSGIYGTLQTTSQPNITANNSNYLGGTAAASYLLSSTAASTYVPLSGTTMTGALTISSTTDQQLTLNATDNSWQYVGFSHSGTRKAYFGINSSGNPEWGTDSGAFTITGNYTTIGTSTRSPIFYDSDNTGYYLDPASTTNINALTTAGAITTSGPITALGSQNYSYNFAHGNYSRLVLPSASNGAGSGEAGFYFWISEPGSTWTAAGIGRNRYNLNGNFPRVNTTLSGQMIRFEESDQITFYGTTSGGTNYTHGYMTAGYIASDGSMRSPIFYDLNDTGYYVNPNGTSYCSNIQVSGSFIVGAGGTWTAGSIYSDGNWGMLLRSKQSAPGIAQFAWYEYGGGTQLLRIDNSYNLVTSYPVYASLFYDVNDAAYYVDPASTTNIKTVRTSGNRYNNISFASRSGHNSLAILWNGKLFTSAGNAGSWNNATTGRGTNNTLQFWGAAKFKQVAFPAESSDPIQVGGFVHSFAFALFANGNLYTWGNNNLGQLGLGDTTARGIPTLSATGVTNVYWHGTNSGRDVDGQRLFIKKTDGYIYGCGYNGYGSLGLGDTTNRTSWTQITALGTNVTNVWNMGASYGSTVVQKSDQSIWAAGNNGNGQLGLGNTTQQNSFVNVTTAWGGGTGYTLKKVIGGFGFADSGVNGTCWMGMLLDNGTTTVFRTAGNRSWGSIGNGVVDGANVTTPATPNVGSGRIADVAGYGGGTGTVMCLKVDGTLYAWGRNASGQCGNGGTAEVGTPFITATGVAQIFCDGHDKAGYSYYSQSFHRRNDGRLYACGFNDNGYCGIGNATNPITSWTQVKLPYDAVVIDIAMFATTGGGGINVFLTNDGRLFFTGYNGHNGINNDTTISLWAPVQADFIHG